MNELERDYRQALEETREELRQTREAYMQVVAAYNEATAIVARVLGGKTHGQTLKLSML